MGSFSLCSAHCWMTLATGCTQAADSPAKHGECAQLLREKEDSQQQLQCIQTQRPGNRVKNLYHNIMICFNINMWLHGKCTKCNINNNFRPLSNQESTADSPALFFRKPLLTLAQLHTFTPGGCPVQTQSDLPATEQHTLDQLRVKGLSWGHFCAHCSFTFPNNIYPTGPGINLLREAHLPNLYATTTPPILTFRLPSVPMIDLFLIK